MEKRNRGAVTAAAALIIIVLLCAYNLHGGKSDVTGGSAGTESAETVMTSGPATEPGTEPPGTTEPETVPPGTDPPAIEPPETKPAETKPAETKPAETKPAETKPAETKPAETKPAETKPAETKPAETKPAETKPAETKPAETKPAETKPIETKPVETKPAETKPAETKPAETRPPETEPPETKPAETEPPETSTPENMTADEVISAVCAMKAGETVDFAIPDAALDGLFYAEPISDSVEARITGVSYRENGDISLSELRYVRVLHAGFDGKTHVGELIVNELIAEDVVEIMRELYRNGYEIEKMLLVDEYGGDDGRSMADNNSSAFNYRTIANTSKLSNHALGMAVDINPLYNPYVTKNGVYPENGAPYADRSLDFRAKIDTDDLCYKLFTAHGFEWGGEWTKNTDYQHFEKHIESAGEGETSPARFFVKIL